MSAIIKAHAPTVDRQDASPVVFNYQDVTVKANAYLDQVKAEAAEIIAKAQRDAAVIRKQAQEQGTQAAKESAEKNTQSRVETQVKQSMQTALPAIEQMVQTMLTERLQWHQRWEQNAVRLATAIAEKIIRREISKSPNITVALVREALELASGSQTIKVYLNPQDHAALGTEMNTLVRQLARLAPAEVIADAGVSQGGCLVKTEYGTIDQRIESQLARIVEELC